MYSIVILGTFNQNFVYHIYTLFQIVQISHSTTFDFSCFFALCGTPCKWSSNQKCPSNWVDIVILITRIMAKCMLSSYSSTQVLKIRAFCVHRNSLKGNLGVKRNSKINFTRILVLISTQIPQLTRKFRARVKWIHVNRIRVSRGLTILPI